MRLGELKTPKQIVDALAEGDNLDDGDVRQIVGALTLIVSNMAKQLGAVEVQLEFLDANVEAIK